MSLLIISSLVFFGCTTKKTEGTTAPATSLDQLQKRVVALENATANVQSKVAAIVPADITKIQQDIDMLQQNISDLQLSLATLSSNLDDLNTRVTGLTNTQKVHARDIIALQDYVGFDEDEDSSDTDVDAEDAVTVDVATYGTPTLRVGEDTLDYLFKVSVTNELNVDLEEVTLVIGFYSRNADDLIAIPASTGLVGSNVSWGLVTDDDAENIFFVSGWAGTAGWGSTKQFSLDANESVNLLLSLSAQFILPDPPPTSSIIWSLEAYCDDYEVA